MLNFQNDYSEGAHEKILKRLTETNMEKLTGYGTDVYSIQAQEKIRQACGCINADIYFISGGTQTNSLVIAALLNTYEGVVSVSSGHIATHEAGAIELNGHKVLPLSHQQGKFSVEGLKTYLEDFWNDESREHMVYPGMVYLSQPTEYGTLYSCSELKQIYELCNSYQIPLYIDGARLGYGLMAKDNDVFLEEIARYSDVFYIGGTKVGALCGEAIVFTKSNTPKHFITTIKQHGALMAKGRLLGIQFDTLFTDDLYFEIARQGVRMAEKLKAMLLEKGYQLYIDSPTNQQFVILEQNKLEALQQEVLFNIWEIIDQNQIVIRLATSWATTEAELEALKVLL